jgi:hypothetical protein
VGVGVSVGLGVRVGVGVGVGVSGVHPLPASITNPVITRIIAAIPCHRPAFVIR